VEVRARFPYRYLHPREFPALKEPVMLESIEVAAYKVPDGPDGQEIFTGRNAVYVGSEEAWKAGDGTAWPRGFPVSVSDAAAERLRRQPDIIVTAPTFHAKSGGCC
jgi:hypothetical protein